MSLSTALILSLSAAPFGYNGYITNAKQSVFATPTSSPMDFSPINSVHHRGKSAFKYPFTLSPQNGKKLNIYVKNNGSSAVILNVKVNDQDFGDSTIPAGGQKTRKFEQLVGTGLSGNYEVYVYNNDGSLYDLNINARQF
ncbi:hypothetical protein [Paenibacillus sp. TY11]|uniref:hypothetical protein n=1 Tax=Paenibacillus sp. TY11 TaxID=3448633 RepID=UPI004039EB0C